MISQTNSRLSSAKQEEKRSYVEALTGEKRSPRPSSYLEAVTGGQVLRLRGGGPSSTPTVNRGTGAASRGTSPTLSEFAEKPSSASPQGGNVVGRGGGTVPRGDAPVEKGAAPKTAGKGGLKTTGLNDNVVTPDEKVAETPHYDPIEDGRWASTKPGEKAVDPALDEVIELDSDDDSVGGDRNNSEEVSQAARPGSVGIVESTETRTGDPIEAHLRQEQGILHQKKKPAASSNTRIEADKSIKHYNKNIAGDGPTFDNETSDNILMKHMDFSKLEANDANIKICNNTLKTRMSRILKALELTPSSKPGCNYRIEEVSNNVMEGYRRLKKKYEQGKISDRISGAQDAFKPFTDLDTRHTIHSIRNKRGIGVEFEYKDIDVLTMIMLAQATGLTKFELLTIALADLRFEIKQQNGTTVRSLKIVYCWKSGIGVGRYECVIKATDELERNAIVFVLLKLERMRVIESASQVYNGNELLEPSPDHYESASVFQSKLRDVSASLPSQQLRTFETAEDDALGTVMDDLIAKEQPLHPDYKLPFWIGVTGRNSSPISKRMIQKAADEYIGIHLGKTDRNKKNHHGYIRNLQKKIGVTSMRKFFVDEFHGRQTQPLYKTPGRFVSGYSFFDGNLPTAEEFLKEQSKSKPLTKFQCPVVDCDNTTQYRFFDDLDTDHMKEDHWVQYGDVKGKRWAKEADAKCPACGDKRGLEYFMKYHIRSNNKTGTCKKIKSNHWGRK